MNTHSTTPQSLLRRGNIQLLCSTLFLFLLLGCSASEQQAQNGQEPAAEDAYLFSYFKGNGDGLHLAYSEDGYHWSALRNDTIFLKPTAGNDKLMRDPCIIRGKDGRFHMVWTVSWNEKGIGYASSADLLNWSEQQFVPVMAHEPGARNTWAPELTYDEAFLQVKQQTNSSIIKNMD